MHTPLLFMFSARHVPLQVVRKMRCYFLYSYTRRCLCERAYSIWSVRIAIYALLGGEVLLCEPCGSHKDAAGEKKLFLKRRSTQLHEVYEQHVDFSTSRPIIPGPPRRSGPVVSLILEPSMRFALIALGGFATVADATSLSLLV